MPASNPTVLFFYDFNGIYAPKLGKHAAAEMMAGIGWESLRFYTGTTSCGAISCTDFVSSNHFMGHIGGGLRYYFHGHFFVRPEAHLYMIHNNFEFSSPYATRFGVSLGYTFAPGLKGGVCILRRLSSRPERSAASAVEGPAVSLNSTRTAYFRCFPSVCGSDTPVRRLWF